MYVGGLRLDLLRHWCLLNDRSMGHVAAESLPQRRCVVRENLRVVRTAREESTHQWQREHGLDQSYAMATVAERPEFEETVADLRENGYHDASPREVATEIMAKAMGGDPSLKATDEERENIVRSFLTEAVEEKGPEILQNFPDTDPRVAKVINEVRRGYDYGDDYDQRLQRGGVQAVRGDVKEERRGVRKEAEGPRAGELGEQPSGESGQRGVPEERPKEDQLKAPKPPEKKPTGEEPVFQRANSEKPQARAPKPPASMALAMLLGFLQSE